MKISNIKRKTQTLNINYGNINVEVSYMFEH